MVSILLLFEAKLKRESAKMALGALSTLKLQSAEVKRTGLCSAPTWPTSFNKTKLTLYRNLLLTVNLASIIAGGFYSFCSSKVKGF
jgi:hypothetical protein